MQLESLNKHIAVRDGSITFTGMGASPRAYLVARLFLKGQTSFAVVLPDQQSAWRFAEQIAFFLQEKADAVIYFPPYHVLPSKGLSYHPKTAADRVAALYRVMNLSDGRFIFVTAVDTFLQKVMPRETLSRSAELVINGEELDREKVILRFEETGYTRTSLVEGPGEYAVRGGIIDFFSPAGKYPVRIEFFGDFVDSLRTFSPTTQRGMAEIEESVIIPANEAVVDRDSIPQVLGRLRQTCRRAGLSKDALETYVQDARAKARFPGIESMLPVVYPELSTLFDFLPESTVFMLDSPEEQASNARDIEKRVRMHFEKLISENTLCPAPEEMYLSYSEVADRFFKTKPLIFKKLNLQSDRNNRHVFDFSDRFADNDLLMLRIKRQEGENILKPLADWLNEKKERNITVFVVVESHRGAERIKSLLAPYGIEPREKKGITLSKKSGPGVYCVKGRLKSGFVDDQSLTAFLTEEEIFGERKFLHKRRTKRGVKSQFIAPEELREGDIVVHMEHGIGAYQGLKTIHVDGISQDYLLIVYQDGDKLYLPVDRMEMIGKYIGVDGYTPLLDKMGGKTWQRSKARAKKEVEKLAGDLLNLYAKRRVNKGFAFSKRDAFYGEFEGSFPYEETPDQVKAIEDVLEDMESDSPMDRLVCGDVGYGKTEVAMRAAFKAVNDSKQVAVVAPTTILCEQHLKTFKERFQDYPVRIASLSRFKTVKEQQKIVKETAAGTLDIVIGTHRLLQKDIFFKSLGLLVVDEEQRFGVKHKERLKKKRSTVDVLALTATPIPRTLHLSLTGMRDISVISTPPADRMPIFSYICKNDDLIAAEAVRKEMARGGQIFYVHNNIKTIFKKAQTLEKLVPEARIEVAHGRLPENILEKVMIKFINRKIDMIVCTTIIESGLDIPSANTMIIDRTDKFGLSQIYQLRGRIGRGDEQAYAYLFVPSESSLTKEAQKRLAALMEYRDLGSGFQIAMKDLQIRGAGTALGVSQSGHIAAVGYDMFLKLLDHAVKELKGESPEETVEPEINVTMSAFLPHEYIQSVEQRLTIYRRLSKISRLSELSGIKSELIDRFGKVPRESENMLLKIMLRVLSINSGIERLDLNPVSLTLVFSHGRENDIHDVQERLQDFGVDFKFMQKNSMKIILGRKRKQVFKSLKETVEILKGLAGSSG